MVRRKLNKPTYKIGPIPIFWLSEMKKSRWTCNQCKRKLEKGSICFEVWARMARKNADKKEDKPIKRYLCLQCAEDMLESSLEKVRLAKNMGAAGYKMMDEM